MLEKVTRSPDRKLGIDHQDDRERVHDNPEKEKKHIISDEDFDVRHYFCFKNHS